jgi:serine/threonine-protein kinase RsbW
LDKPFVPYVEFITRGIVNDQRQLITNEEEKLITPSSYFPIKESEVVLDMRSSFSIVIPSDIAYIKDTILHVRQRLNNFQYPLTLIEFDIPLAITEALANAIIHGNKSDRSKTVKLSVTATPDVLICIVTDMGNGYNYSGMRSIPDDEDDPRTHGRGLNLIKNMMSKVSFNERGNQIRMVLKIKNEPVEVNVA